MEFVFAILKGVTENVFAFVAVFSFFTEIGFLLLCSAFCHSTPWQPPAGQNVAQVSLGVFLSSSGAHCEQ